jgi:hypothetical protein
MEITLNLTTFRALLMDVNELAYKRFAIESGMQKKFISRAEADRRYGRPKVQFWIDSGEVTPGRDKTGRRSWNFEVMELDAAAKADKRFKHINIK